jgi:hypothetical protein
MLPFINSFYALDDNKKKASKYFIKLEEVQANNLKKDL